MSSYPVSIRFEESLLGRLRRWASRAASTPSGLTQELVDEGLRMRETPGVVFRDGPSGRRASLVAGPDIWEVIAALKDTPGRADQKTASVADELGLPLTSVELAVNYYSLYPAEIEAEVADNEQAAEAAFAAWQARQAVLA
jgi:hypothetical protein